MTGDLLQCSCSRASTRSVVSQFPFHGSVTFQYSSFIIISELWTDYKYSGRQELVWKCSQFIKKKQLDSLEELANLCILQFLHELSVCRSKNVIDCLKSFDVLIQKTHYAFKWWWSKLQTTKLHSIPRIWRRNQSSLSNPDFFGNKNMFFPWPSLWNSFNLPHAPHAKQ